MPTLEAIKRSCPAIAKGFVAGDQGVELTQEEWDKITNEGKARCTVTTEQQTAAGITWGCRYVTEVEPSGCPLRNGDWVKVRIK